MNSTGSWWRAEINWETEAGALLKSFLGILPKDRHFEVILYGSAPLQMTVDPNLLSGDVDLFCADDFDLAPLVRAHGFGKECGGLHIEPGFELSFRASPRWRTRATAINFSPQVTLVLPHPLDVLIGKLSRLEPKDIQAFQSVIGATGHPTPDEMKLELQNAVDLFRPNFEEESPNLYAQNTEQLWREVFHSEIDVRREIIAPAIARRKQGYGETSPDYKNFLREYYS
jgi:hypothetical protein